MDFPEGINKINILINARNLFVFCLSWNVLVKSSASGSSFVTSTASNNVNSLVRIIAD